jgi:hypothetical protein
VECCAVASRPLNGYTKFALAVLTEDEDTWSVPTYIRDGLVWLKDEVKIELEPEPTVITQISEASETGGGA